MEVKSACHTIKQQYNTLAEQIANSQKMQSYYLKLEYEKGL